MVVRVVLEVKFAQAIVVVRSQMHVLVVLVQDRCAVVGVNRVALFLARLNVAPELVVTTT